MSEPRKALLLVGSPKGPKSASQALGGYLLDQLRARACETAQIQIHRALRSAEGRAELLQAVDGAHVVILAFPLYVDSPPAATIRALEMIAQHRRTGDRGSRPQLVAIANCGFPEARQCDNALAVCRRFAQEAGLAWAGGLAMGGGPALDGRSVAEAGGMVRSQRLALDLAAEALGAGQPIPQSATAAMGKQLMPSWLYAWFGSLGWKSQAKPHGTQNRLRDRPYGA